MSETVTYLYENGAGDDIRLEYTDGHVRLTIDFLREMDESEIVEFARVCKYKLKKAPLRIVKGKRNEQ